MTPDKKRIWKTVAIVAGITLVLTSIVIIIYQQHKKKKDETEDENPYVAAKPSGASAVNSSSASSAGAVYTNGSYTKAEVERMQSWLFSVATIWHNNVIVDAIRNSGGIDGKMGNGFNKALTEAIRVKYVTNLQDLYDRSKTQI